MKKVEVHAVNDASYCMDGVVIVVNLPGEAHSSHGSHMRWIREGKLANARL